METDLSKPRSKITQEKVVYNSLHLLPECHLYYIHFLPLWQIPKAHLSTPSCTCHQHLLLLIKNVCYIHTESSQIHNTPASILFLNPSPQIPQQNSKQCMRWPEPSHPLVSCSSDGLLWNMINSGSTKVWESSLEPLQTPVCAAHYCQMS